MKFRDEKETVEACGVMMMGDAWEPEETEPMARIISTHLKKTLTRTGPESLRAQGRVQFVARFEVVVIPEFGMPLSETRGPGIAGEFEMPIVEEQKK